MQDSSAPHDTCQALCPAQPKFIRNAATAMPGIEFSVAATWRIRMRGASHTRWRHALGAVADMWQKIRNVKCLTPHGMAGNVADVANKMPAGTAFGSAQAEADDLFRINAGHQIGLGIQCKCK